jgi:DMSO/TMAO reductase YedYZ molybdopterin-dependent catalytic subunit
MIHLRRVCFVIGIFVALVPAIYGQTPQASTPEISLSVSGEVERPLKLTAADLGKLPCRSVRAKDHGGKESEYEGSPPVEVLKLAGVKFGEIFISDCNCIYGKTRRVSTASGSERDSI